MKLRFPKKKWCIGPSVYGRTDVELSNAVSSALLGTKFPTDKDYDDAHRAIVDAFHSGMDRGYGGFPSDHGNSTIGAYMVEAQPWQGTFTLYRKIV